MSERMRLGENAQHRDVLIRVRGHGSGWTEFRLGIAALHPFALEGERMQRRNRLALAFLSGSLVGSLALAHGADVENQVPYIVVLCPARVFRRHLVLAVSDGIEEVFVRFGGQ